MPSAAEILRDEFVKHQVRLDRFANNTIYKVISLLNTVERDIVLRLQRADNETLTRMRLEQLLADIRLIERQGWQVLGVSLDSHLSDAADAELAFVNDALKFGVRSAALTVNISSPAPTVAMVIAAVKARPFNGRFLSEWLSGVEEADARRVREAIRVGYVEGEPIPKIVQRIRGTRAAMYRDGAMDLSRRSAEAMVRTAITHTASMAHQVTYEANADIVSGVRWVSVLDSRTTVICAGLDGQVFPLDSGPRPPQHINCRSTIIPEIDGMDMAKLADRPTFDTWLRKQPVEVQNEILGPTRRKLWLEGGLKLDRFTDSKRHILTLMELKARDAEAFAKAGI